MAPLPDILPSWPEAKLFLQRAEGALRRSPPGGRRFRSDQGQPGSAGGRRDGRGVGLRPLRRSCSLPLFQRFPGEGGVRGDPIPLR